MSKFTFLGGRMTRVVVSLSTAVLLSGAGVFVPQIASAVTIAELQASIAALTVQLNALIAQQGGGAAPTGKCTFTRDLFQGVSGDDVKCLQQYLNGAGGAQVAASGAGSPGSETTFFGGLTRAAVSKWQAANSVSPTAGYFGPLSRAKYDMLMAAAPAPSPSPVTSPGATPAPVPAGTGLSVSAATQPGDSLAPLSASRVPATKFTLTASADGDITVNNVTVERQGPAADSSVSGAVLLDEDGLQIGLSKTLNSNHQAILNQKFTVKAGTSKTITVALNRPTSGSDGGSILKLAVVAIDAGSATVSGTLPIVGSPITLNSTLSIGSATLARGVNDPGAAQTKEIGTKGYIFSAVRMTGGSNEDLSVRSISFNQSGSASAADIKNVIINAGGTDYPAVISSDGKYYTVTFGDGINVAKGNNFEFYVKGDVESGTNRTVDFDLYRFTDLYVVGKSYGYGITPTGGSSGSASAGSLSTDTNPSYNAYAATIGVGTLTVTASNAVPAQNIAVNLLGQPLGAFDIEAKGESITVSSMIIRVSTNKNDDSVTEADYTQVALYDLTTGKAVAGPLDGSGTTDGQMIFTFTDAVSFPVGKRAYVLKTKLSTDFNSDTLVSASTTPSSDWTSVKGDTSGDTITPANTGTVSTQSMTVKAGAVTIALASTPAAQTVIRGANGFTFANVIFDVQNSGEDVRFTSIQMQFNNNGGTGTDVSNCQLWDGATALNTGTNIINPTTTGDKTFTLDNNLTLTRATSKTLALKCDVSKSGTGNYVQWTFGDNDATAPSETHGAVGLTSGTSITPAVASSSVANLMTFSGSGTLTLALESPTSVRLAQAGTEVEMLRLRLTATNEGVDLKQISFQLSATASNTPNDISKIKLYEGSNLRGEVEATSSDTGLKMAVTGLMVDKGVDKIVTVKALLANIDNTPAPGRPGHLVVVDWDQVSEGGNSTTYGVGNQSGDNIYSTGSDSASNGVRLVRSYPTFTALSVPSTSLADASGKSLYRFSVSAPAGANNGVSLFKFTFNVATNADDKDTGTYDFTITNLKLYAYLNSSFSGDAYAANPLNQGSTFANSDGNNDGITRGRRATTTDYAIYFNPSNTAASSFITGSEAIQVAAGQTIYFELKGDVAGADSGDTATIRLMGDSQWYGIANTSGGTIAYADDGYLAGSITYGFATTAPVVDALVAIVDSASGNTPGTSCGVAGATQGNSDAPGAGCDFIWSGNSTTTHSGSGNGIMGPDWYNGFQVPGLPSDGASSVTFSL